MIISRSSALLRLCGFSGKSLLQRNVNKNVENSRKGHGESWYYRKPPSEIPRDMKIAEFCGAVLWWWITWHLITDYHELLPHNPPDPSKWTDEELGIPPV